METGVDSSQGTPTERSEARHGGSRGAETISPVTYREKSESKPDSPLVRVLTDQDLMDRIRSSALVVSESLGHPLGLVRTGLILLESGMPGVWGNKVSEVCNRLGQMGWRPVPSVLIDGKHRVGWGYVVSDGDRNPVELDLVMKAGVSGSGGFLNSLRKRVEVRSVDFWMIPPGNG